MSNLTTILWFIERGNIDPNDADINKDHPFIGCYIKSTRLNTLGKAAIDGAQQIEEYNGNIKYWLKTKLKLYPIEKLRNFISLLEDYQPKGILFDSDVLKMIKRSSNIKFLGVEYVVLNKEDKYLHNKINNILINNLLRYSN